MAQMIDVPPEQQVDERKINWGIMAYEGDPGADMIRAIRNIEFYSLIQSELLKEILEELRKANAKPATESKGVEPTPKK